MSSHLTTILAAQYEAALCMLNDCVMKCPAEQWAGAIAKYPFWQVAYHTLYCTDIYLTVGGEAAFTPHPVFHPKGMEDIRGEYPSRMFSRDEVLAYLAFCREKMSATKRRRRWRRRRSFLGSPCRRRRCTSTTSGMCSTTPASSGRSCGGMAWR
jgi:hypothetical protein